MIQEAINGIFASSKYITNTFEDISIYKTLHLADNQTGVIISKVKDFKDFKDELSSIFDSVRRVILINDIAAFVIFHASPKYFRRKIQKQLTDMGYYFTSVFLKNSHIINSYGNTDILPALQEDLYYLPIGENVLKNPSKFFSNFQQSNVFKSTFESLENNSLLYGFSSMTNLYETFYKIHKHDPSYPCFAISTKYLRGEPEYRKILYRINHEKAVLNLYKYPKFKIESYYDYIGFMESEIREIPFQKFRDIYHFKYLQDIQINCIYDENQGDKSDEFTATYYTIRTFLGFRSYFECLHALDYFQHLINNSSSLNHSFIDAIFVSKRELRKPEINLKYDLFYLEVTHFLLSDLCFLYSIDYIDHISLKFHDYFSFANEKDMLAAAECFRNEQITCDQYYPQNDVDLTNTNALYSIILQDKSSEGTERYEIFKEEPGFHYFYIKDSLLPTFSIHKTNSLFRTHIIVDDLKQSFRHPQTGEIFTFMGFRDLNTYQKVKSEIDYLHPKDYKYMLPIVTEIEKQNSFQIGNPQQMFIKDIQERKRIYEKRIGNKAEITKNRPKKEPDYILTPEEHLLTYEFFDSARSQTYNDDALNNISPKILLDVINNLRQYNLPKDKITIWAHNIDYKVEKPPLKKAIQPDPEDDNQNDTDDLVNKRLQLPNCFHPKPDLHYFYFLENPKARKVSPNNTESLILFGVKKCKDTQRYKLNPLTEDESLFTFFGFDTMNDCKNNIETIKSKRLSLSSILPYTSQVVSNKPSFENLRANTYWKLAYDADEGTIFFDSSSIPPLILKKCVAEIQKADSTYILEPNYIYAERLIKVTKVSRKHDLPVETKKFYSIVHGIYKQCGYSKAIFPEEFCDTYYFYENQIEPELIPPLVDALSHMKYFVSISRNAYETTEISSQAYFKKCMHKKQFRECIPVLRSIGVLFDYDIPYQRSILFQESLILKNPDDFQLILEIIRSLDIKILRYERNVRINTYGHMYPYPLFEIYSFIELESEVDKMVALNKINEIVYAGRKNVLKYNTNLHYAKYNKYWQDGVSDAKYDYIIKSITSLKNVQYDVLSIENIIPMIYLGFSTIKELNGCMAIFRRRAKQMNGALSDKNIPRFFYPKPNVKYLRMNKSVVNQIMNVGIYSLFIDMQEDCLYFDGKFEYIYTYIGFTPQDAAKLGPVFKSLRTEFIDDDMNIDFYNPNETIIDDKNLL